MKYKLKEIVTALGDGIHGTPIFDKSGEYYFFNGNNIENGNLVVKADTKKVNYEEYKKYKKDLNNRTIFVSINGTIGKVGIYNNEKCILGKSACYLNVKEEVNRDYIKFLLMDRKFQEYIKNYSTGTTIKNMSLKAMREFEFELPIKNIQNKVAHILNSIERKIELNTHINNNLQDFLLSQYKLYFDNKETNGKLKDIVKKMNRTIKRDKINKLLKYYPIDILPKNNIILQEGKDIEEAQSSLIEFNSNEILVGAMRIYFHRVCISNNAGITRNTTFVLTPKQEEYLYYALLTIYQDSFIEYASLTSKGTTMPYAVWENVCSEFNIYIPTKEELKEFNVICKAIINKMNINQEQNNKLEKIRDTLLPKLMNGEIDLDKIEI